MKKNSSPLQSLTELCRSVLKLNKKITFVAVVNEKGKVQESLNFGSIINMMPRERKEIFFMEYSLRHKMREEFNEELGHVRYTYAEREKRGLFSFPMTNNIFLVVACQLEVNPKILATKIISLIMEYQKNKINLLKLSQDQEIKTYKNQINEPLRL
ncbi:MAG: hypothetical protein ACREAD_03095 [Nitrosopumilaceae archaeon]